MKLCKLIIIGIVSLALFTLILPSQALAIPVYGELVDPVDYTGFIQYSDGSTGLFASEGWADSGTKLLWGIRKQDSLYIYQYTWHTEAKDLGNFILELTDCITDVSITAAIAHDIDILANLPIPEIDYFTKNLPNMIYGIKLELPDPDDVGLKEITDFTFVIETLHAPVWGNFYTKDGKDVYAYNTGLDSEIPDNSYIPRPDGQEVPVPEPATLLLLGFCLTGLGLWGRKRG